MSVEELCAARIADLDESGRQSGRCAEHLCQVIASYGGRDKVMGAKTVKRLEQHLDALGVEHDVKVYDQVGHSFMSYYDGFTGKLAKFPTPMNVGYNEAAAEDAWGRMLAFFGTHVAA